MRAHAQSQARELAVVVRQPFKGLYDTKGAPPTDLAALKLKRYMDGVERHSR